MVRHQHICEKLELEPLVTLPQRVQEQSLIIIGQENVPALIAAR